ncbi:MAG: DUF1540 domain-containing protein [Clostridiales bacterium]|nr:DUF1540 domain-containing protein [Clostridiales bacterium]
MEKQVLKEDQPISNVKCTVDSCYYNSQGNYCNASSIEISPPGAKNTEETDCITFINKQQEL